ncbi:fumarylacetoacetate hydrolase family protein [Pelagicoccus sp. SDUM812003]|uniref:fumarylacetoacetate hydrolase family protein n=1 Tax=Pelagicoccus sp. SDUM812003 TaxID=3041267 RepID=UPI00280DA9B4|nr:fumarylacetoacetate hydrolase family protein [Pelagicoccus sp. SDUM812003]MDQ8201939.1 fumarylacetoacetate hydrolase family protein [Pelagicoccus sp. SDUM812003]
MYLTRHSTPDQPRWALNGSWLPPEFSLSRLLATPLDEARKSLSELATSEPTGEAPLLPPIETDQEVWASGVTYLSSRMAREAESQSKDVYQKVYEAERPELFFKATGWRVKGHQQPIRVRADSAWDVPEPELTLVLTRHGEILGYTVGNDVSSRSIEGENPLYLPQAKVYDGSCALGPGIRIADQSELSDLPIRLEILRLGETAFKGETRTSQIKRPFSQLADFLVRELDQPNGAFLMTGTGVVPSEAFTLNSGDRVRIDIDGLVLENPVD